MWSQIGNCHNIRYPLYWPLKWDFWAIGQSSRERDSKLSSMGIRVGGYWVRRVDTLGDIESSWPTWLIVQSTRLELKMPRARIAIRNALWRFYTRKWRPRISPPSFPHLSTPSNWLKFVSTLSLIAIAFIIQWGSKVMSIEYRVVEKKGTV